MSGGLFELTTETQIRATTCISVLRHGRMELHKNVGILPVCDHVSVARSKGALVGRHALAGTILGMTPWRHRFISDRFSLFLLFFILFFFKFPKLSALLQKLAGLSTLSSNLAKPSPEPSLRELAH